MIASNLMRDSGEQSYQNNVVRVELSGAIDATDSSQLMEFVQAAEVAIPQYHQFIEAMTVGLTELSERPIDVKEKKPSPVSRPPKTITQSTQTSRVLVVAASEVYRVLLSRCFQSDPSVQMTVCSSLAEAKEKLAQAATQNQLDWILFAGVSHDLTSGAESLVAEAQKTNPSTRVSFFEKNSTLLEKSKVSIAGLRIADFRVPATLNEVQL